MGGNLMNWKIWFKGNIKDAVAGAISIIIATYTPESIIEIFGGEFAVIGLLYLFCLRLRNYLKHRLGFSFFGIL